MFPGTAHAPRGSGATFQEDQQTYYGRGYRGQKPLWTITLKNPNARHEEVAPETWETFGDNRGNNGTKAEGYRKLNGPTWVGEALAARLTGMVPYWNHPAFFDYVDRWWQEEHQANDFVKSMWEKYREKSAVAAPPPGRGERGPGDPPSPPRAPAGRGPRHPKHSPPAKR